MNGENLHNFRIAGNTPIMVFMRGSGGTIIGPPGLIGSFDSGETRMRSVVQLCSVIAITLLATNLLFAQESPDSNRRVAGGGITVPDWQGKVDSNAERAGQTVNDAKLSREGNGLHVTT